MVLPPGATTGIITVNIVDDSISETRETFAVQLLPVSGVQLIQDSTEITINDNDGQAISFISKCSYQNYLQKARPVKCFHRARE